MPSEKCHCGKPLHYPDAQLADAMRQVCKVKGEYLELTIEPSGRRFAVPRHWLALHRKELKVKNLEKLGFVELAKRPEKAAEEATN